MVDEWNENNRVSDSLAGVIFTLHCKNGAHYLVYWLCMSVPVCVMYSYSLWNLEMVSWLKLN